MPIKIMIWVLFAVGIAVILRLSPDGSRYIQWLNPRSWVRAVRQMSRGEWAKFIAIGFIVLVVAFFARGLVSDAVREHVGQTVNLEDNAVQNIATISPWLLLIMAGTLPVFEEWLFRGVILSEIRRVGKSTASALFLSSLMFGSFHLINTGFYPPGIIPMAVVGVLFGVAFLAGGLKSSILSHSGLNIIAVLIWVFA